MTFLIIKRERERESIYCRLGERESPKTIPVSHLKNMKSWICAHSRVDNVLKVDTSRRRRERGRERGEDTNEEAKRFG